MDDFEIIEESVPNKSILKSYGEVLTDNTYITNPAIARDKELEELTLILLTPDKSAILVGKPGIGKTAIVEGLSYKIQEHQVPNVLLGYKIVKINSSALVGTITHNNEVEMRLQVLVNELKNEDKVILFVDEIHTLIGDKSTTSMDLANILKPGLDRGTIKMIGATTTDEYERYLVKDRAFIRRFEKVVVEEPTRDQNVQIMLGTLPKIEKKNNIKLKYTAYTTRLIMEFLTDCTSEYKRDYILSSKYPDITLTLLSKAFSYALYEDAPEVNLKHIYLALVNTKSIYPDTLVKEVVLFKEKFKDMLKEENIILD